MATARNQGKTGQADDQLTEKVIEERVGSRSFQLGQRYFMSGAVFDCRREGELLKARCEGNSADSYFVTAHVTRGQIKQAECHCPVGSGGNCKHVAAVLLARLHAPDQFRETAPLEERLSECGKPQLIELIQQMVDRDPDLESWLELALRATVSSGKGESVEPETYRRQAVLAFSSAGEGWEADRDVAAALDSLKKIGDQFLSQKNLESASAVYRGILDGIIGEYESSHSEADGVRVIVDDCITHLGEILSRLSESSKPRQSVLQVLFDVIRFDVNSGGIGLSGCAQEILIEQATQAEKATIASWIREVLPANQSEDGNWERRAWGGLLLDLESGSVDDNVYVKQCREFGLTGDLVERLLDRGRLEEALHEIRSAADYDLMGLADRLIAHNHVDIAHIQVRDRLFANEEARNNWQLREWLKRFYQPHANWQPLLELCVEEFRRKPSFAQYQEIRKLATKLTTWDAPRSDLLSCIPPDSNDLIRIYLDEGAIDQAICLWESRSGEPRGFAVGWDRVDLQVAQAAEEFNPETALKIYRTEVDNLIAARGRQSYQSACQFLKKIRSVLTTFNRGDDWEQYISRLREKNRSLRALQEELVNARL